MVFRESRVVDEVWAGVAPRALAGEALLIVRPQEMILALAETLVRDTRCLAFTHVGGFAAE